MFVCVCWWYWPDGRGCRSAPACRTSRRRSWRRSPWRPQWKPIAIYVSLHVYAYVYTMYIHICIMYMSKLLIIILSIWILLLLIIIIIIIIVPPNPTGQGVADLEKAANTSISRWPNLGRRSCVRVASWKVRGQMEQKSNVLPWDTELPLDSCADTVGRASCTPPWRTPQGRSFFRPVGLPRGPNSQSVCSFLRTNAVPQRHREARAAAMRADCSEVAPSRYAPYHVYIYIYIRREREIYKERERDV